MSQDYQHMSGGEGHIIGPDCWCQPVAIRVEKDGSMSVATPADRERLRGVVSPVRPVRVRDALPQR